MAIQGLMQITPGRATKEYTRAVKQGIRQEMVPRIMNRRPDVFGRDRTIRRLIANRLGWVDVASSMTRRISTIESFGKTVLHDGIKHVVLMGMGGSSLCPEVFGLVFGRHPNLKSYQVIDSTDPAAIKTILRKIQIKKTLFVVASKSGGTVETRSHEAFFLGELKKVRARNPGRHFAAITDAGSDLQRFARRNKYRKIFVNPSDIGGRYSALSFFGLVPAFFAGVDLKALLDDAIIMEQLMCDRLDETNPALQLGAIMAGAAKTGMDKMSVIASKGTAPFVPWVEQLVAESTGKKKKGVIPVEGQQIDIIEHCGKDRSFLLMRLARERPVLSEKQRSSLIRRRIPVVEIVLGNKYELGRQFLLWEAATAVTGRLFGINPFDEPNVTESKDNTKAILAKYEESGDFPGMEPIATWGRLSLLAVGGTKTYTSAEKVNLTRFLTRYLTGLKVPGYLSILCYLKSDSRMERAIDKLRSCVTARRKVAVLRGYGPRYLHSIGQLYKGGPPTGAFIVFTRKKYGKLEIPGSFFDFGQLIEAQAIGDAQALIKRKLPTLVVAIDGDPISGIETLTRAVNRALK